MCLYNEWCLYLLYHLENYLMEEMEEEWFNNYYSFQENKALIWKLISNKGTHNYLNDNIALIFIHIVSNEKGYVNLTVVYFEVILTSFWYIFSVYEYILKKICYLNETFVNAG